MTALTPAAVAALAHRVWHPERHPGIDHAAGVLVSLLTGPTILAAGVVLGVIAERCGWVR